jgi:hypothetical protein
MSKPAKRRSAAYGWAIETTLPDESDETFIAFESAMMRELAPKSEYARSLASDILHASWDIQRHRRLLAALVRGEVRRQVESIASSHVSGQGAAEEEELNRESVFAAALLRKDPTALEVLAKEGKTFSELTAAAFESRAYSVDYHETRIADLERRRCRLMAEYERLQTIGRERIIEDAVEVD